MLAALGLALAASACDVPREQARRPEEYDLVTVLNLRRAAEALQDRAREEQEHVDALNQQLTTIRADEERVYADYLQAERDYQLRQSDLAGVETDVALADAELVAKREELEAARAELATAQAELEATREQLAAARVEMGQLRERAIEVLDLVAQLQTLLASASPAEIQAFLSSLPPQALPGSEPVRPAAAPEPVPAVPEAGSAAPESGAEGGSPAPASGSGGEG